MKTIEQQRASAAWAQVEAALNNHNAAWFSEYSQHLQGLPVTIHTAGLGQTVAFYLVKGRGMPEKPQHLILRHLAAWLLRAPGATEPDPSKTPEHLMQEIQGRSSERYRRLTAEAHAYLNWLKRFAAARTPEGAPAGAPAAP